ncbi:single-stranded DNA-binding protein [Zhouia sp. PK063]|uniref:single-stranded DNA-binding protein n=1 Tax=Zhouia sp. PK063 TaxID=3373602 RepID=UPI00379E8F55
MNSIRNFVQLIGHVGEEPVIHDFENGKKVARLILATNELYRKKGETHTQTEWHRLVAWGKQAEILEGFVYKGTEIVVRGKLSTRSYVNTKSQTKYVTEILVQEVLLLGKA